MRYERLSAINENPAPQQPTTQYTADPANGTLYDLSMLFEMDDNDYVAQLLTIFLRDTPKELQEMKDAVKAKKINVVGSNAHKIKGSSGIIRAHSLSALLEQVEEISKLGKLTDELSDTVEKARSEYIKIQGPLQNLLKELI